MFLAVVDIGGFGEAVGAYGICPADRTEVQQRFFPEFAVVQDKIVARRFRHHRLFFQGMYCISHIKGNDFACVFKIVGHVSVGFLYGSPLNQKVDIHVADLVRLRSIERLCPSGRTQTAFCACEYRF